MTDSYQETQNKSSTDYSIRRRHATLRGCLTLAASAWRIRECGEPIQRTHSCSLRAQDDPGTPRHCLVLGFLVVEIVSRRLTRTSIPARGPVEKERQISSTRGFLGESDSRQIQSVVSGNIARHSFVRINEYGTVCEVQGSSQYFQHKQSTAVEWLGEEIQML
ncbi:hypothetical protein OBBRIDRAFT_829027 [Obba rivulosa]|uniref:Uncharacterized protein n=1 Tax=Obba rivulosa TaxID=1052685 RepID=A0A8E2AKX7_9APHY|nr:hypothetical protein OBBRIDRAFT_829027 [Obba rivulosa]